MKNLFLTIWCILFAGLIIGYTIYSAATTYDVDTLWGYHLVNIIAPPYIILVCLGWVYMHFRYYVPLIASFN